MCEVRKCELLKCCVQILKKKRQNLKVNKELLRHVTHMQGVFLIIVGENNKLIFYNLL